VSCVHTVHTAHSAPPHNHSQPQPAQTVQNTICGSTGLVLLMMGIMMPETCWDRSLIINIGLIASCWFLSLHPRFFLIRVHKLVHLKFRAFSSSLTFPITSYKVRGIFWVRNERTSRLTEFLTISFYVLLMLLLEISFLSFPDVISGPRAAALCILWKDNFLIQAALEFPVRYNCYLF